MIRRYFAEFNRVRGDSIRIAAQRLRGYGLRVSLVPHRTALKIVLPKGGSWTMLKNAILAQLHASKGSVLISSEATGNTFVCNNSGNRPGRFQRL